MDLQLKDKIAIVGGGSEGIGYGIAHLLAAEAERVRRTSQIPIGRIGIPQDIACLVALLISPRGRYINGTSIPVDGGSLAALR